MLVPVNATSNLDQDCFPKCNISQSNDRWDDFNFDARSKNEFQTRQRAVHVCLFEKAF